MSCGYTKYLLNKSEVSMYFIFGDIEVSNNFPFLKISL